jgi:Ni,Fe-hydrogenase III large subunit
VNWAITKNNKAVPLRVVPVLGMAELRAEIVRACGGGEKRPVLFFGVKREDGICVFAVLADDENSRLLVSSAKLGSEKKYESLTPSVPAFHIFERELHEEFGIIPEGHPWLKPVRYGSERAKECGRMEEYPFFKMQGEEVHEVAVGPVHAGVIEPGHFRFMCHGEDVYHLEIQLGYQHRGVESLFLKGSRENRKNHLLHLAESAAGDSVIAHATAYAQAAEALTGAEISNRAMAIRGIALELERAGIHIGGLGAISNDVAFLMGSAVFGATRTLVINTSLALCGSRFGRGLMREGGVNFDIDDRLKDDMRKTLHKVLKDVTLMSETMFDNPSVLSRLEKTGIVTREQAQKAGLVGMAARASGIPLDVRADHPFGIYRSFPVYKITLEGGDVFSRAYIRYAEIQQSIKFIIEQLDNLPEGEIMAPDIGRPARESLAVSLVEGWRGETVHAAVTDAEGRFERYKIKDPSFQNWFGLALAVRSNGISDFPLCNKSFDLSYCGNDL